MLEIRITDPHTMDPDAVRKIAAALIELVKDVPERYTIAKGTDIANPELFIPGIKEANRIAEEKLAPVPVPPKPYTSQPPAIPTHNPFKPMVSVDDTTPIIEEEFIPVAPEKVTNAPTTKLQLDKKGFPWDSRIHSRNRSINSDGTWRYMRNLDKDTIEVVEDELRKAMGAPKFYNPPPSDNICASAPPPPLPPATTGFPGFMLKMTSAINSGKVNQPQILAIVKEFGIPSIALVGTRDDLIPAIIARIDEILEAAA